LSRLIAYLRYFLYCVNEHSLHAPFVYDFYTKVIRKSKKASPSQAIEVLRASLLNDSTEIEVTDFGAGKNRPPKRIIKKLARVSSTPFNRSLLLREIIKYTKAQSIIELGTSLGLNTLYLASVPGVSVVTFEGSDQIAGYAEKHFRDLSAENICVVRGSLQKTLKDHLGNIPKIDFVYFDADHRYEPTLEYYTDCLKRSHDDSVFVFDDIHWSSEMERAWNKIKASPEVTLSIDLYFMGIIFFNSSLNKHDYILSY